MHYSMMVIRRNSQTSGDVKMVYHVTAEQREEITDAIVPSPTMVHVTSNLCVVMDKDTIIISAPVQ